MIYLKVKNIKLNKIVFSIVLNIWFISGLLRILSQVINNCNTFIPNRSSVLSLPIIPISFESEKTSKTILALKTLRNFNFEGLKI